MDLKNGKSILTAVDFSKDSVTAVEEAIVLGKALDLNVTIFHAIHDPAHDPGFYQKGKKAKKLLMTLEDGAQEMMKEFIKKHDFEKRAKKAGVKLSEAFAAGRPQDQIVRAANKKKYAMVVIGSSGRTGLSHLLMGSVAERVAQLCAIPVLVVKASKKK